MALEIKFTFCGIEIPKAYIRVQNFHGDKFIGWTCDVCVFPSREYAQPFEEPGPLVDTGEFVKNEGGSYALDGNGAQVREQVQQPGVVRMNTPLAVSQMSAPYIEGVAPADIMYAGLKLRDEFKNAKDVLEPAQ